jgi:F-type H+-transporting ATPase subunit b
MKLRNIALLAAPLAIAIALSTGGLSIQAQSPTAPQTAPAASTSPAPAGEAPSAAPAEGHEGAEAEGHHPQVKLFGFVLNNISKFLVQLVNFAIFFAILYFILKGALSSAFKARAKELEEQLTQAEKDKAEGEAQLKELETKMAGMQKELEGIMAKAETDAEAEKQRILEAAQAEASQILAQTQAEIEFQKRLAEKELRALVAELAIEGAAKRLEARVQGATAEQVLDRAIAEVGGAK